RFIETLPRRGYRLIAPVDPQTGAMVARVAEHSSLRRMVLRLGLAGAAVALLAWSTWHLVSGRVESSFRPPRVVPFTSFPDRAEGPAFSPDGNYVAFARYSDAPEVSGIYIKQVDGSHLLQLTKNEKDYFCCPVWSPDGRYIAFSRYPKEEHGVSHGIYIVSAIGGAARKLFSGAPAPPPLDWSPD